MSDREYNENDPSTWFNEDDEKQFDETDLSDSYENIPAGIYTVEIMRSEAKMSSTGRPMLSLGFEVIEGQFKKRFVWVNYMMNNEVGMKNIKVLAAKLGFSNTGIKDIAVRASELVGYTADINVSYKNDFTNIKIITCHAAPTGSQDAASFQSSPPDALDDTAFDGDDPFGD